MVRNEKLSEVVAKSDPETVAEFAGIDPGPAQQPAALSVVKETPGVLWSVRGHDFLYLIAISGTGYDVHNVERNSITLVESVGSMDEALRLIQAENA